MNTSTRERCSNEAKVVDVVTVASTFRLFYLFFRCHSGGQAAVMDFTLLPPPSGFFTCSFVVTVVARQQSWYLHCASTFRLLHLFLRCYSGGEVAVMVFALLSYALTCKTILSGNNSRRVLCKSSNVMTMK